MNIILLSGGSGKRLWPLSNETRSKQFLRILNNNGNKESMLQRVYRQIKDIDRETGITVATSCNQASIIRNQLGCDVDICVEPYRRDTFPAIALAALYLKDIKKVEMSETVIVCPADGMADDVFFNTFKKMDELVSRNSSNIILMGIEPKNASEKFGYIIPKEETEVSRVKGFKEKPDKETAKEYVNQGALWNSGTFGFCLEYIVNKTKELTGVETYEEMLQSYEKLEKISFDYAVVEHEESINVLRFSGEWEDIGTWNSLSRVIEQDNIDNVYIDSNCVNTHVINELSVPVITMGLKNEIVVASPDGILVAEKQSADKLKDIVDKICHRPMIEERVWGNYKVIDYAIQSDGTKSLMKHLTINAGENISYQKHKKRKEIWTIIEGKGCIIINGEKTEVEPGDTVSINPEEKHAVFAYSKLHIIEVQIGIELIEEDIERFDWEWDDLLERKKLILNGE